MMGSQITQKQIAKIIGFSQATVSLALGDDPPNTLPKETVNKIILAANDLGYVPNRFATALRTSKTMSISCIVPDIANPFYPSLVRGVQSVAEKLGYDVIVLNSDGCRSREQKFVNLALRGQVDGIVGVFFSLTAVDLRPLVEEGIPVIRIEVRQKAGGNLPIDDVFSDNFRAAYDITNLMISKGHSKIAMIAGRRGPQEVRVQGYSQAIAEAGLADCLAFDADFSERGGIRATQALFERHNDVTAIVASNDMMAIGAMNVVRKMNRSVPGDVAIAGFDDIPAASLVYPRLTSVAWFQGRMGEVALQQLIRRLDGTSSGEGISIEGDYQIKERESA